MPINRLTLGIAALLAAGSTLASASYTVRNGDTLSGIAEKLHVSTRSLQEANGLSKKHTLRLGMKLTVPKNQVSLSSKSKKTGASPAAKVPACDAYTVKNGDNDWTIANHAGIKLSQLHRLNPSTKWGALRVGTKINLPAGKAVAVATPRLRSRVAVVKADDVTIRRGPSTEADAICTTVTGTRVAVLAREGAWYKLQFPKGTVGWIRGDFLKAAAPAAVASNKVHRVTTTYVAALRTKKATKKVAAKSRAARVAQWQKHQQNVKQRYVRRWSKQQRRYVVAPITNGGDLIAQAETFKGVRYSWGSASRSGTDCSGFTTQVFRSAGVKLPRTSQEQARVGNNVSRGELSKGDLVFFHTGRGHRVTHVGIYMGNNKFIHASSGGGKVQVNDLSESYYSNRFVTGRRVPTKSTAKRDETKSAEASSAE